jgi:four helix bundle protein
VARESGINSYRDLLVCQKGMVLARQVHSLTRTFPDDERFGIVVQMRRAAVSVPSNIAEGQAQQGRKEFVQFLSHAEGSLAELDTQLVLAVELGYCQPPEANQSAEMIVELQKMLASLRRKVAIRLATNH